VSKTFVLLFVTVFSLQYKLEEEEEEEEEEY
jgi:hypothetical protein